MGVADEDLRHGAATGELHHGVALDRVEIDATSADWLIARGIATPEFRAPVAEPEISPEPKPLQRKEPKQ